MLVRFQMNFNLSCNPDFAQTLTFKSYHSCVPVFSVSHTPQVAAMIANEQSTAVSWFDCCSQNFKNSQQFNVLRQNSKKKITHFDDIRYVFHHFGEV